MRKLHFFLLVVAAIMALSSAYSLAAINQVYKMEYKWYSQLNKQYCDRNRETSKDRWTLQDYPEGMKFCIIGDKSGADLLKGECGVDNEEALNIDFDRYVLIYCTLGRVCSPEYRIKVVDIAQRGGTVEVRLSTNSPDKLEINNTLNSGTYYPEDLVLMDKASFPSRGRLFFIFKNQDGKQLYSEYYEI